MMKNEEKVEEKNVERQEGNNNKSLFIVIIILSIVVVGLITFICYDKIINKDNNKVDETQEESNNSKNENKEDEKNESKPVALEKSELDTLTNVIESMKSHAFLQNYIPLNNINEIQNKDLLMYVLNVFKEKKSFTKDEVEQLIKQTFGDEIKVTHQNIPCSLGKNYFIYNSTTGTYTYNNKHIGHGGGDRISIYKKYMDSYKIDNTYTIKYKMIYGEVCSDMCFVGSYFASINDAKTMTNPVLELNDVVGYDITEELFKTIEDKVPVTTFTYEKNSNGTFNLKSIVVE